jgi:hypothetical protein
MASSSWRSNKQVIPRTYSTSPDIKGVFRTTWLLPGAFPSMLPGDGNVAYSTPVLLSGNSRRKPLLLGLRTRHRFAFSDAHTGRRGTAYAEHRPPDLFRFRSR